MYMKMELKKGKISVAFAAEDPLEDIIDKITKKKKLFRTLVDPEAYNILMINDDERGLLARLTRWRNRNEPDDEPIRIRMFGDSVYMRPALAQELYDSIQEHVDAPEEVRRSLVSEVFERANNERHDLQRERDEHMRRVMNRERQIIERHMREEARQRRIPAEWEQMWIDEARPIQQPVVSPSTSVSASTTTSTSVSTAAVPPQSYTTRRSMDREEFDRMYNGAWQTQYTTAVPVSDEPVTEESLRAAIEEVEATQRRYDEARAEQESEHELEVYQIPSDFADAMRYNISYDLQRQRPPDSVPW